MAHLNIQKIFGHDIRSLVDGLAGAIKNAPEHIFRYRSSKDVSGKLTGGLLGIDSGSPLKHLDNRLGSGDLEDLSCPVTAI